MRILVACEESGRVTAAFRAKGHDAWSCDIKPTSGPLPQYHLQGNALKVIKDRHWDMLIAFPPCTYLTKASAVRLFGGGKLNEERYQKGLAAKRFFQSLLKSGIERICVENPTPLKIFKMPPHSQVIQPYEHGHPYSKRTLLWLRGLPLLQSTKHIKHYKPWVTSSKHRQVDSKACKRLRSKTFEGIARAMADQWG